jgi:two-component system, OmpR family, phosphate regulon response regulator PhoB
MEEPNLRILVAEDDRCIQRLLSRVLTREGYSVECANDGTEAMLCLRAERFDVVLLDFMMPGLTGGEVVGILEVEQEDALDGVIMVTASAMKAESANVRLPIIRKPFEISDLLQTVRQVAAGRHPAQTTGTELSLARPVV